MMNNLRRRLAQYANGVGDHYALEDWITANLQSILDSNDAHAIGLVNELQGLVVRIGEGIAEEDELRERVCAALDEAETVTIAAAPAKVNVLTEGNNDTLALRRNPFPAPTEDLRLRWPGLASAAASR